MSSDKTCVPWPSSSRRFVESPVTMSFQLCILRLRDGSRKNSVSGSYPVSRMAIRILLMEWFALNSLNRVLVTSEFWIRSSHFLASFWLPFSRLAGLGIDKRLQTAPSDTYLDCD